METVRQDIGEVQNEREKRKNFKNYDEKVVQAALVEIRSKLSSCRAAHRKYNIPMTTLHNRLKEVSSFQFTCFFFLMVCFFRNRS